MAIKKSALYSSLWRSCDELRGGMDASQYKDYILTLLFIKYVSDKHADDPYAPVTIPTGASFQDMVKLKGTKDIGDQINKKVIAPLAKANELAGMPDFNDDHKLGTGKEMADRLTNLIAIFEDKELDFSKNRASDDDLLGDAYEYLMRHFATESGKSKGQFYTPAEVSRLIAQLLGIREAQTSAATSVYDPTCGSGSLLLKVADEAGTDVTLYGQEKDVSTATLAHMNMILHNNPTATIKQGNTLANPKFLNGDHLRTFDYVVSNPPFSDKRWSTGLDPKTDPFERFHMDLLWDEQQTNDPNKEQKLVPPEKQGDYAYLLHILRSLKQNGKGACILPHGVLFRGNAEAEIRKSLIRHGYLQAIIGLPPNLFYGTGIPACILLLDKAEASVRQGIFLIDASNGFIKDGPKNRLRARDIHKIVDVFRRRIDVPQYARFVSFDEIEKNDFNLNLPRYIDNQAAEDRQDINGHLQGGIPSADIDALRAYWEICPNLRATLFSPRRPNYLDLCVEKNAIKSTIHEHPEFAGFVQKIKQHFGVWRAQTASTLEHLPPKFHPKQLIASLSESLLQHFKGEPLVDAYAIYQHLMDAWEESMQDDAYMIAADGWKAKTYRITEIIKKGKKEGQEKDKGWACDLIPKSLMVARHYAKEQAAMEALNTQLETVSAELVEMEEEHSGEEGAFSELDSINKANVNARLKELKDDPDAEEERKILKQWLTKSELQAELKKQINKAEAQLDQAVYERYPNLTEQEVKVLVVQDKWLAALDKAIHNELDRVSQQLTQRIKELAERYEHTLPELTEQTHSLEAKVQKHLARMGFAW